MYVRTYCMYVLQLDLMYKPVYACTYDTYMYVCKYI